MRHCVDGVNLALTHAGVPVAVRPGGEIDAMWAAELDDEELRALAPTAASGCSNAPPRVVAAPLELVPPALQGLAGTG